MENILYRIKLFDKRIQSIFIFKISKILSWIDKNIEKANVYFY